MKVNDTALGQLVAAGPQRSGGTNDKAQASATEPRERISVPSASDTSVVRAAESAAASTRAQRVQEIISAVKSGQYYPSPQQIANQLVSEAEIAAKLRAMLS
ncbi:MAG: flagellar biosynthesis anti-sigma factor FlgM [Myxococcaceae bacterium]|jgi:anti-sigma28 factor (negative regulator of flagellin synthesis)|nr:flagellar biosynthesis anti-sigma factor FlgM [Myxococcaceae bacterium]